jgi:hypothetical protein
MLVLVTQGVGTWVLTGVHLGTAGTLSVVQVSDFGLSRVEDDDSCATFPFNSCGTAAYVAPEALITTKKVRLRLL